MEVDKRVTELETEFKILKGEIKELLVDIREDLNRNENPFYNIQNTGMPKKEPSIKEPQTENCDTDCKTSSSPENEPVEEVSVPELPKKEGIKQEVPDTGAPKKGILSQKQEASSRNPEGMPMLGFHHGMDTFLLLELMRWADYSVRKIGRNNLSDLMELYSITGQLSEEVRNVIQTVASLSIEEGPAPENRATMKDNIEVISQLNAILNPGETRFKA